jgi:uncharacterized protein
MKFHLATARGNLVTAQGPGWVRVGATEYRESLVLTPDAVVTGWAPGGFEALTANPTSCCSARAAPSAFRTRA